MSAVAFCANALTKRSAPLVCLIAVLSPACHNLTVERIDDSGSCDVTDMSKPAPDMATPAPRCAAARGLAGDNLLCVDFDKVTQLSEAALAGWNFNANTANCWQISGGYLQVQNWTTFTGNCGVVLPSIDFNAAPNTNYQRATISIVHRIDLDDMQQPAQVYLDLDKAARLVHQMTGKTTIPNLGITILTVNKSDLPTAVNSVYRFWLNVSVLADVASAMQGWQIMSVSVNGIL